MNKTLIAGGSLLIAGKAVYRIGLSLFPTKKIKENGKTQAFINVENKLKNWLKQRLFPQILN